MREKSVFVADDDLVAADREIAGQQIFFAVYGLHPSGNLYRGPFRDALQYGAAEIGAETCRHCSLRRSDKKLHSCRSAGNVSLDQLLDSSGHRNVLGGLIECGWPKLGGRRLNPRLFSS